MALLILESFGFFCRLAEFDRSLALKLFAIQELHQIDGAAVCLIGNGSLELESEFKEVLYRKRRTLQSPGQSSPVFMEPQISLL